ncbi:Odorant receptor 85f [Gryllus bimaculatus]|nr:Odorant receptor 85f [Gryllus bimaculatus]
MFGCVVAVWSVPVNSVAFVSYLTFYLIEMGQLLLYCWFCSDIKDKSEEVSSAVYASDWISADPPMKHNLSIFMMRAASPVKLDAMGFVNVDLDLFTSVMQASYSFFTVLSQMKDTEGEK